MGGPVGQLGLPWPVLELLWAHAGGLRSRLGDSRGQFLALVLSPCKDSSCTVRLFWGPQPMAGREQHTRPEILTETGTLGHVFVPKRMPGFVLACRIHAATPPPAGRFWNNVRETEALTDSTVTFAEAPTSLRIAIALSEDGTSIVVSDALQLTRHGHSLDELTFGDRLVWCFALNGLLFPDGFTSSIDNVILPSCLRCLTFGRNLNQSIGHVILPSGLQSLTFGDAVNIFPNLEKHNPGLRTS